MSLVDTSERSVDSKGDSRVAPSRVRRTQVTLHDVAKLAEVDTSTASRALRSSTRHLVRPDTVARVVAVAAELNYRVNPVAKGLKEQRTMTIGMILPDLANPLFPPIVRGIEDGLRKKGYVLILANTDRDSALEKELLDVLLSRQIDGLILATAELDYPQLEEIMETVPTILVNRATKDFLVPTVSSDDYQGIGQAVQHLHDLGHRRIAHVGGSEKASTGTLRYQHYLSWMHRLGLEVDPDLVVFADWVTQDFGEKACTELLAKTQDFTAIIAGSDLVALGCYAALRKHNLSVPEDVSVVGYNGIIFCNEFSPPLTSVHVPKYDIGLSAASLIIEAIENPGAPAVSVLLPTTLQVRSSTKSVAGIQRI